MNLTHETEKKKTKTEKRNSTNLPLKELHLFYTQKLTKYLKWRHDTAAIVVSILRLLTCIMEYMDMAR